MADNDFAKRLRAEMKKAGLTQTALAQQVGVAQPTVWGWLNGSEIRLTHYLRLIAVLPALQKKIEAKVA